MSYTIPRRAAGALAVPVFVAALVVLAACDKTAATSPIVAVAYGPRDTVPAAAPPAPPPPPPSTEVTTAELPRSTVSTAYPAPLREVRVPAGADLQAAIDAALPGDALLLAPGATYVGNFTLPDKGVSDSWIVIRTDVDDALLGAPGTRMTPSAARAARLAAIMSPNTSSAVATDLGANHYRLTGVEVSTLEDTKELNALIRLGMASVAQSTEASIAHHLIIDRSWVHGSATLPLRRCVMLNSASSAVIDSWLGDCHSNVSDSQAIVGWNGPGPYLIENNHLEGGHEVVMFGGSGVSMANQSPSDITIRGNHIMRPLAWKGVWQAKNLLETKHARRVLIEGNVLENNWADAQAGFALVLKSENQDNDAPWSQSTDITIRYNKIRNTGNGFNLAAHPSRYPAVPAARIVITDNVLENVNVPPFVGGGHTLQLLGALSDIVMKHNTVTSAAGGGAFMVLLGDLPAMRGLVIHSNILMHGGYGLKGTGTGEGLPSIDVYAPDALVRSNVIIGGGDPRIYPAGNFFMATLDDAGVGRSPGGEYRLTTQSFRGLGFDGADIGADIDAVAAATAGAVVEP